MKYLIAGTGGVGGSIAGFLSLAGKDVTCIARGGSFAGNTDKRLEIEIGLEGRAHACYPGNNSRRIQWKGRRNLCLRQGIFCRLDYRTDKEGRHMTRQSSFLF